MLIVQQMSFNTDIKSSSIQSIIYTYLQHTKDSLRIIKYLEYQLKIPLNINIGYSVAKILHEYFRMASVELSEQTPLLLQREFSVLVNSF